MLKFNKKSGANSIHTTDSTKLLTAASTFAVKEAYNSIRTNLLSHSKVKNARYLSLQALLLTTVRQSIRLTLPSTLLKWAKRHWLLMQI